MPGSRKYSLTNPQTSGSSGFGILSDEPDYRICWLLNNLGSLGLVRMADLVIESPGSTIYQAFSCFESSATISGDQYRLLSNRSREGAWLTGMKQVDFILVIHSQTGIQDTSADIRTRVLSRIPEIRGIFELSGEEAAKLM